MLLVLNILGIFCIITVSFFLNKAGIVGYVILACLMLYLIVSNYILIFGRTETKGRKKFHKLYDKNDTVLESIRSRKDIVEEQDGAVREALDLMINKVEQNTKKFDKYLEVYDYVTDPGLPDGVKGLIKENQNILGAFNNLLDEVITVQNSTELELDMQGVYDLIDSLREVSKNG